MSVALLDTNVLMALAWPNHLHHESAHRWFSHHAKNGWATCPVTQCGFVRISSNPRLSHNTISIDNALTILQGITAHKNHVFWPADIDYSHPGIITTGRLTGHQQVTDSYLLILAIKHHGSLVTFDKGIKSILPDDSKNRSVIELLSL